MFVCFFSSHSRIFHSCEDVTIAAPLTYVGTRGLLAVRALKLAVPTVPRGIRL